MALTQVSTGGIKDGTIVDADINASAAIAASKLDLPGNLAGNLDYGLISGSVTGTLDYGSLT